MTSTVDFQELGHIYKTDEGVIVPSVSQVLTLAGLSDLSGIPPRILEKAAAIGTAVHLACEYLDHDDLDLESIDPLYLGYVVGYQKFKEDFHFSPKLIEHRKITTGYDLRYGMCVDRLGRTDGPLVGTLLNNVVLDIKTSSKPQPHWQIQTAAYACGLGNFDDYSRAVVHVAKDGTYKFITHDSVEDEAVWLGALTVAHFRLAHGAKIK